MGVKSVSQDRRDEKGQAAYLVKSDAGRDVRGALAKAVIGAGAELLELRSAAPTLEEMFVEATTEGGGTHAA